MNIANSRQCFKPEGTFTEPFRVMSDYPGVGFASGARVLRMIIELKFVIIAYAIKTERKFMENQWKCWLMLIMEVLTWLGTCDIYAFRDERKKIMAMCRPTNCLHWCSRHTHTRTHCHLQDYNLAFARHTAAHL